MEAFGIVFKTYQYYGLVAFIATVFLTPLAIRAAHRWGVLDIPDQKLKPHARPIPYLGGAAICGAWALSLIVAMIRGIADWHVMLPLLLGGVAMSILGLVDDVRQVRPKVRLIVGTLIVALTILATRAGFYLVDSLLTGVGAVFLGHGMQGPSVVTTPISIIVGVFVVMGACNSANLIDGLDGLCSGVTALISLGFFFLAGHMAAAKIVWGYEQTGDPTRLVLAIAMFGAALGFLPWNFNPAKIFMGDAGSVLLGYNCGMLILLFGEQGKFRWILAALMIFALPVFDTALAMFRRWRAGRSIFEGDRSHFYDQLVQRGFSVRQTVLISYGLTVFYGLVGLLMIWVRENPLGPTEPALPVIRTRWAVLLYLGVCGLTALLAWWAGLTTPEEPRAQRAQHAAEQ